MPCPFFDMDELKAGFLNALADPLRVAAVVLILVPDQ